MGAIADAKELYEKLYSTGCVEYSLDAQDVIREWCDEKEQLLFEQQKLIGKLEAKVATYEAIISNSNFSMAITGNKENTNDDLLETEVDYPTLCPLIEILESHGRLVDSDMLYASIAKDTYLLTDESDNRDYGMYLIGIKEKIDEAPTANVVEVTDKSMIPLVKDFVKDLEKLGGRATCDDIIKR